MKKRSKQYVYILSKLMMKLVLFKSRSNVMGEHKVTFISVHSGAGGIITDSGTV